MTHKTDEDYVEELQTMLQEVDLVCDETGDVFIENLEEDKYMDWLRTTLKGVREAERERILDISWRHCGTDAADNLEEAIKKEALTPPNSV